MFFQYIKQITLALALASCFACATNNETSKGNELATKYSNDAAREVNTQEDTVAAKEQLICTRETETGSRFAKRVCRTSKELQEMRDRNREQRNQNGSGYLDPDKPPGI